MCLRITEKGQVRCQVCNYGPVLGTITFQNPHKTEKDLYSCSNCGKLIESGMFLKDYIADLERRGISFKLDLSQKAVLIDSKLTEYGVWFENFIADLKRNKGVFELDTKLVLTNK